ncbi:hypothetical protein QR680_001851 [Steinernema hermaphroditum]|uniref:receptor protein-tyrosine kinase n=1 Tax=Steinernema hermaphroditum TaxID=289476 RepID=A0AA39LGV5_9BILA|nr:hypothetical protein QR680_001851 [Steinernema hermaphroditum]
MILLPSVFLFLLFWSCDFSRGLAQASQDNPQHVRLFDVLNDLIAVGGEDVITVHRYDGETVDLSRLESSISLKRPLDGFDASSDLLHLKLLNSSSLSYCDPFTCWLCNIDKDPICRGYVVFTGETSHGRSMKTVECIVSEKFMTVRYIDTSSAASIVKFVLNNATIQNPSSPPYRADDKEDAGGIRNQNLINGFYWDGFTYFVGSAERIYQPYCKTRNDLDGCRKSSVTNVRITRVCDKDESRDLESRMEISLSCGEKGFNTSLAAYFEESSGNVSIAFAPPSLSSFEICNFNIEDIKAQFESTWSVCQKIQQNAYCSKKNTTGYPECKITSRTFDKGAHSLCKRYYERDRPFDYIDMCALHTYGIKTYRHGWLENFDPLPGSHVMSFSSDTSPFTRAYLTTQSSSGSLFMLTRDEQGAARLNRFVAFENRSIWSPTSSLLALAPVIDVKQNKLFYAQNSTIKSQEISCKELYQTCDRLPHKNVRDPLQCVWCIPSETRSSGSATQRSFSFSATQENTCSGQIVFDGCPPDIERTILDTDGGNISIYGSNFLKLEDTNITVCGKTCRLINRHDTKLSCEAPGHFEVCKIEITGNLPSSRAFKLSSFVSSTAAATTSTGKKKDTTTMKAVISVVAIVVLILIIGLIVYLIRRYKLKKEAKIGHSTSGGSNVPLNYRAGIGKAHNDYNIHFPNNTTQYDHLFGNFDEKDKINMSNLNMNMSDTIGQGHYGSVYKGTYILPNGEEIVVACKTLHQDRVSSVGDFLREAEVMCLLHHPRILPFVGVHYDKLNHRQPILVTKYMANGDLHHYVRDSNRSITLNQLLNFCLEAAEAMKYLHSKGYIHRDLAARNCMLDEKLNVCLADFGLSRPLTANDAYDMLTSRELPITSLSLEALDGHFSVKSDVWAFGNLMWEVTTRGWTPWEGDSKKELQQKLHNGERLSKPAFCPVEIYRDIMLCCWEEAKENRPSFTEIIQLMNETIVILRDREAVRMNSNYEMVAPRRS